MGHMKINTTPLRFTPNTWLAKYGRQLVEVMFPDGDAPADFGVKTLVQTSDRMVMRITSGDKTTLLKAFNSDSDPSVSARYREIAVLLKLSGTNLIPQVFAHNRIANWILMDFVQGQTLRDAITAGNAVSYARALGAWYGEYTDAVVSQSTAQASNWYAYLDQYKLLAKSVDYSAHRDLLEAMPIDLRVVAKNDALLQNFVVGEDGNLIGIDFEKAELKPYGWDIMVTARLLVRLFPKLMLELTEALVDGWNRGTDKIDAQAFLALTRTFASTTAFTLTHENVLRLRERLRVYNAQAEQPVTRIHEAPYMHEKLVDQPPERAAMLAAYLEFTTHKIDRTDAPVDVVVQHSKPEVVSSMPSTAEDAFCGTCKGSCCQQGADNMGFLKPAVLAKAGKTLNLKSKKAVIRHYVTLLPEQHIDGSCYFHGSEGCTIPRDIRSDTCNAFQCNALQSFNAAISTISEDARVLLYSGDEGGIKRATVIEDQSVMDVDCNLLEPHPTKEGLNTTA